MRNASLVLVGMRGELEVILLPHAQNKARTHTDAQTPRFKHAHAPPAHTYYGIHFIPRLRLSVLLCAVVCRNDINGITTDERGPAGTD